MKPVKEVYETFDYSKFKTITGNRKINPVQVHRLVSSFKESYLFSPIIVNEHYEIIDGQHRFEAAKQLGLPINFIVCEGYSVRQIQVLNASGRNWSKMDYLKSYCDMGSYEYLRFRAFMKMFPSFNFMSCYTILLDRVSHNVGKTSTNKAVKSATNKSGAYVIKDFDEGRLIIPDYNKAVENAKKILEVSKYYAGYNRWTFVATMVSLFKNKNYDHTRFLAKLKKSPSALTDCANKSQYKALIEEIYNKGTSDKVSLRY